MQRQTVLEHYCEGDIRCVKCGFTDVRALTLDHVNGGGNQHRKELKGASIYRWIVNHNFPEGFQILCMNCQFIKKAENNEVSSLD